MPGPYAHITLVNQLRQARFFESTALPVFETEASIQDFFCFCELGAVSPDYPNLAAEVAGAAEWADAMHYRRTGEMIRSGAEYVRKSRGGPQAKLLAPNGKFVKPDAVALPERLVVRDGKPAFLITDQVYLSQKDVRQVQLAKGAIRAGIEFLLKHAGVAAADLDRGLIAGSFGFHLTAASLTTIGLLPRSSGASI